MKERIQKLFFSPMPALSIAIVRIVLYSFFIYKLLSRDFSIFGLYTREMLDIYPYQTFSPQSGYVLLSQPFFVELATFHWIHWLLPLPNVAVLNVVEWSAVGFCSLVLFFGKGSRNFFAIAAFIALQYLWGFCWRSGAEVDSVFIQLQLALLYCFFKEREALTVSRAAPLNEWSSENGAFYSLVLLVFITYYCYSGINKLIDISPSDWFRYNLNYEIGEAVFRQRFGFYSTPAPFSELLLNQKFVSIGVPLTYLMELSIPIMFFYRKFVAVYLLYFVTFHFMTWTVGILFFGNILIWLALLPVHIFVGSIENQWGLFRSGRQVLS